MHNNKHLKILCKKESLENRGKWRRTILVCWPPIPHHHPPRLLVHWSLSKVIIQLNSFVLISCFYSTSLLSKVLVTQKPIKRPSWWKRKFALFWTLATWGHGEVGGGGGPLSKGQLSSPTDKKGTRAFTGGGRGGPGRNSTVSSVIVNGLGAVSLQFQGCLFPFPWGQLSELWQLCHGCNLVIKWLTSPIWSGFQYL